MVKVRIPAPLRRLSGGASVVEVEASNILECIEKLEGRFPGMKERLLEQNGQLKEFINIYVNGEDIRFLQNLDTPLKLGDEVSIIPAIAGGGIEPGWHFSGGTPFLSFRKKPAACVPPLS